MPDMSVAMFARLFKHQLCLGLKGRVAFLGGEPTVATTFRDIMSYYLTQCFHVGSTVIFSNLAGTPNVRWFCEQKVPSATAIIWNNTGINTYAKNIQKAAYASVEHLKAREFTLSMSVTYVGDTDIDYLVFCKNTFNIQSIRFAVDSGSKLFENPEKIDALFLYLQRLIDAGFRIMNDTCGTMWLEWFNDDQRSWLQKNIKLGEGCRGSAGGDILPDGSFIPCMPYWTVPNKMKFLDSHSPADLARFYKTNVGTKVAPCGALAAALGARDA
jgi:hypothetical protein